MISATEPLQRCRLACTTFDSFATVHYIYYLKQSILYKDLLTFLFLNLLLTLSGDIHQNPGPVPSDDSSLSSLSDSSSQQITSCGLSLMHLNVQSLKPKLDIIEIEAQQYDILVFTETWLSPNTPDEDLRIANFSLPYRCDRTARVGGGVAIYVRDGINVDFRQDLHINRLEAVWVEIIIHSKKLLVGGIYRPPDSNNEYWQLLEESVDRAFSVQTYDTIVAGDFNINTQTSSSNKMTRLIESYNAEQLITSPTHFTEHSSSLIDLIFIKYHQNVITSFVADPFIPDLTRFHCPVVAVLKLNKPKQNNFKRRIWLYDKGDYDTFRDKLRSSDLHSLLSNDNVDESADILSKTIIQVASETIPNKEVTIRPGDIPWMNNDIRKLIRKRAKLHKKAKQNNTDFHWSKFRKIRNDVTTLIRKSKLMYQNKLIKKINSNNVNPKEWYKCSKKLTKKQSSSSIPSLNYNNIIASSDQEKVEVLNDFVSSQSKVDDKDSILPPLTETNIPTLSNINITQQDVLDSLSLIDPSKACGPDLVSPKLLREAAPVLASPLAAFFNKLIRSSSFPTPWKLANVTPIFKKSDPTRPENYRPISLLSCIGKLMERCVHKYLYNHLVTNNLLTPHQSGFIRGDSTVNQLVYLYNDICQALDQGKEVRAVFCDISKAFDRVWHQGLLYKLSSLGLNGSLLQWFSSYLSCRRQRVQYRNVSSAWVSISAGVPQGSILGPLLFLVYINDIVNDISSNIKLFADDTSLYIVVDNPLTAATSLNSDLDRIHSWANTWLVSFNPEKTKTITFSRKLSKPSHPSLSYNSIPISQVTSHKHLGVTLSHDARWKTHIHLLLDKAWKRIGLLRSFKFLLSRISLERMYYSFVRPLLEYADVVWDNLTDELNKEIESVQN